MKKLIEDPYVLRTYPSPSTGLDVQVLVKEVLLSDYPNQFVEQHFSEVNVAGGALFSTDIRGMRAWQVDEFVGGPQPNEQPWQEVWYADKADTSVILDIIKYTGFYDERSMDRFKEFRDTINEISESFGIIVMQANEGGVAIRLVNSPNNSEWDSIITRMYAFNKKYFTTNESKKNISKRMKTNHSLFWGYC